MKEYWVDFSGYLRVKADNEGDAEEKFWHLVSDFNMNKENFANDVWQIDCIEEYEKGVY